MTYKAPATIRFPAVPADGPPSWPGAPRAANEELITERAISVPRPAVRDRANLTLLTGPSAGEVFALAADETVIGRDEEANLRTDDTAISRLHAKIIRQPSGEYLLEDLRSTNGTYVGSEPVTRRILRTGEQIQLGPNVLYRFAMTDETEERLQRQLFESSIRDSLTHAHNRKYLNERLAAEVAHAHRHHTKLALLMLDLDDFKGTNDRHGHLAGDAVLRQVAEAVHALIRIEDVFARYGGEEFVVLTRGDGVQNATQLAERLRRRIAELTVQFEGAVLAVTVSIGVAELDELGTEATPVDLLERADSRLYRAKHLGRNQVSCNDH
jgi:diguanylate cyclase (GGDEF)-like protein